MTNVKEIHTGYGSTIAILNDGSLKLFGRNIGEILALEDYSDRLSLVNITNTTLKNRKLLFLGHHHALALLNDRTVWG